MNILKAIKIAKDSEKDINIKTFGNSKITKSDINKGIKIISY